MATKKYQVFYFSSGMFDCQVLCLSYASISSFVQQIQNELKEKNIQNANILFDKLLIAGNNKNRFMSVNYLDGSICLANATTVDADPIYRQYTASYLRVQNQYINNSVLTEKQKRLLIHGCVF